MADRLPLIILAGSDPHPGAVPPGLTEADMLSGFKGIHRLPGGQYLVTELIKRFNGSGRFESPILVGPQHVYEGKVDCEIVHIEGTLADTLKHTFQMIKTRFRPLAPIAISSCDILPTSDEIRRLLETCYDPHKDSLLWWQLVEASPHTLGASAWKPSYHLRPDAGEPLKTLYPGHLIVARPGVLRLRVTSSILQIAYAYRNRNLRTRHLMAVVESFRRLLVEDLRSLASLKFGLLSFSIPLHGFVGYHKMVRKRLTVREFEHYVTKALVHREFHRDAHGRPVRFSITDILAFAKDIDTKAELEEIGA